MVYLWHRKKDLSRTLTAPSSGAIDRTVSNQTDPAACASPEAATDQSLAAPTVAGAQTARPVVTAKAFGDGASPHLVEVTIDGLTYFVSVDRDRDDWQLPEVDAAIESRLLWAIDDEIEAWHADRAVESRRIERVWAQAVSL
jgi:hypothetical protein